MKSYLLVAAMLFATLTAEARPRATAPKPPPLPIPAPGVGYPGTGGRDFTLTPSPGMSRLDEELECDIKFFRMPQTEAFALSPETAQAGTETYVDCLLKARDPGFAPTTRALEEDGNVSAAPSPPDRSPAAQSTLSDSYGASLFGDLCPKGAPPSVLIDILKSRLSKSQFIDCVGTLKIYGLSADDACNECRSDWSASEPRN